MDNNLFENKNINTVAAQSKLSQKESLERAKSSLDVFMEQELSEKYGTDKSQKKRNKAKNTYELRGMSDTELSESEGFVSSNLKTNVRKGVMDIVGAHVYDVYDEKVKGDRKTRTVTLAHGRGAELSAKGERVVEISVGASGHLGLAGASMGLDITSEQGLKELKKYNKEVKSGKRTLRVEGREVKDTFSEKEFLELTLGKSVEGMKGVRLKEAEDESGRKKYNLAGPGTKDAGKLTAAQLTKQIFEIGKQNLDEYYRQWLENNDGSGSGDKQINLLLSGREKGGACLTPAAMALKAYMNENFDPKFVSLVHFEMVKYDPVAGNNSLKDHQEVDLRSNADIASVDEKTGLKMAPLGDTVSSTVFLAMNTEYKGREGDKFIPQISRGDERVILMPGNQSVGTDSTDLSQRNRQNGTDMSERAHRQTYIDAETGLAYRGSAISELPKGIYVCDENNVLVRLKNADEAKQLMNLLVNGDKKIGADKQKDQVKRRKALDKTIDSWFVDNKSQVSDEKNASDIAKDFVILDKDTEEYKELTGEASKNKQEEDQKGKEADYKEILRKPYPTMSSEEKAFVRKGYKEYVRDFRQRNKNRRRIDEKKWKLNEEDIKADSVLNTVLNEKDSETLAKTLEASIVLPLRNAIKESGKYLPKDLTDAVDAYKASFIELYDRIIDMRNENNWELWNTEYGNPALKLEENYNRLLKALKDNRKNKDFAVIAELYSNVKEEGIQILTAHALNIGQMIDDSFTEWESEKSEQRAKETEDYINRYNKGGAFLEAPTKEEIERVKKEGSAGERAGLFVVLGMLADIERLHNSWKPEEESLEKYQAEFSDYDKYIEGTLPVFAYCEVGQYILALQRTVLDRTKSIGEGMLGGEDPDDASEEEFKTVKARFGLTYEGFMHGTLKDISGKFIGFESIGVAMRNAMDNGFNLILGDIDRFSGNLPDYIKQFRKMPEKDRELYGDDINRQIEKLSAYISSISGNKEKQSLPQDDKADPELKEIRLLNYKKEDEKRVKVNLKKWDNKDSEINTIAYCLDVSAKYLKDKKSGEELKGNKGRYASVLQYNSIVSKKHIAFGAELNGVLAEDEKGGADAAIHGAISEFKDKIKRLRTYSLGIFKKQINKNFANLPVETERCYRELLTILKSGQKATKVNKNAANKAAEKQRVAQRKEAFKAAITELETDYKDELSSMLEMAERQNSIAFGSGDKAAKKQAGEVDKRVKHYIDKDGGINLPSLEDRKRIAEGRDPEEIAALLFAYGMAGAVESNMNRLGFDTKKTDASSFNDILKNLIKEVRENHDIRFNLRVEEALVHASNEYNDSYFKNYQEKLKASGKEEPDNSDKAMAIFKADHSLAGLKGMAGAKIFELIGDDSLTIGARNKAIEFGYDNKASELASLHGLKEGINDRDDYELLSDEDKQFVVRPMQKKMEQMHEKLTSSMADDFEIVELSDNKEVKKKEVKKGAGKKQDPYAGYSDIARKKADLSRWTKRGKYGINGSYSKSQKKVIYNHNFDRMKPNLDVYGDDFFVNLTEEELDSDEQLLLRNSFRALNDSCAGLENYVRGLESAFEQNKNGSRKASWEDNARLHIKVMEDFNKLRELVKKDKGFKEFKKFMDGTLESYVGALCNMAEMYNNVALSSGDAHAQKLARDVDAAVNGHFGEDGRLSLPEIEGVKERIKKGELSDLSQIASLMVSYSMADEIRKQAVVLGLAGEMNTEGSFRGAVAQIYRVFSENHDYEDEVRLQEILCHTANFYAGNYAKLCRQKGNAGVQTLLSQEGLRANAMHMVMSVFNSKADITVFNLEKARQTAFELGFGGEDGELMNAAYADPSVVIGQLSQKEKERIPAELVRNVKMQFEGVSSILLDDFVDLSETEKKAEKKIEKKSEEKSEEKIDEKVDKKIDEKIDKKIDEKVDKKIDEKIDEKVDEKVDKKFDEKVDEKLEEQKRIEEENKRQEEELKKQQEENKRKEEEQKKQQEENKRKEEQRRQQEERQRQEEQSHSFNSNSYDEWGSLKKSVNNKVTEFQVEYKAHVKDIKMDLGLYAKGEYCFQKVNGSLDMLLRRMGHISDTVNARNNYFYPKSPIYKENSKEDLKYFSMDFSNSLKEEYNKLIGLLTQLRDRASEEEEAAGFSRWAGSLLDYFQAEAYEKGDDTFMKRIFAKADSLAVEKNSSNSQDEYAAIDMADIRKEEAKINNRWKEIYNKNINSKDLNDLVKGLKLDVNKKMSLSDIVNRSVKRLNLNEAKPEFNSSVDEKNVKKVIFNHLHVREHQVGQTCWAFASSLLLRAQGIDVDPYEIAGYMPKNVRTLEEAAKVYKEATTQVYSPNDKLDIFRELLDPKEYNLIHTDYWNLNEKKNWDEIHREIKIALDSKSPVALLLSGHYVTIVGYEGNEFFVEDSLTKTSVAQQNIINDHTPKMTLQQIVNIYKPRTERRLDGSVKKYGLSIDWIRNKKTVSKEESAKLSERTNSGEFVDSIYCSDVDLEFEKQ